MNVLEDTIVEIIKTRGFPGGTVVKNLPGEISWRREWLPTPVFLPRKFHEQRHLAGSSPWGDKALDMTER